MREVMVVEIGTGVDLQGQDPTKAALRAVHDAIGRVYLPVIRRLTADGSKRMVVHVRLGVPAEAGPVDLAAIGASLPYGDITVEAVAGGLMTPGGLDEGARICIVVAAIEAGVEPVG